MITRTSYYKRIKRLSWLLLALTVIGIPPLIAIVGLALLAGGASAGVTAATGGDDDEIIRNGLLGAAAGATGGAGLAAAGAFGAAGAAGAAGGAAGAGGAALGPSGALVGSFGGTAGVGGGLGAAGAGLSATTLAGPTAAGLGGAAGAGGFGVASAGFSPTATGSTISNVGTLGGKAGISNAVNTELIKLQTQSALANASPVTGTSLPSAVPTASQSSGGGGLFGSSVTGENVMDGLAGANQALSLISAFQPAPANAPPVQRPTQPGPARITATQFLEAELARQEARRRNRNRVLFG